MSIACCICFNSNSSLAAASGASSSTNGAGGDGKSGSGAAAGGAGSKDGAGASAGSDDAADSDEKAYCYCRKVSSGSMVACDNSDVSAEMIKNLRICYAPFVAAFLHRSSLYPSQMLCVLLFFLLCS